MASKKKANGKKAPKKKDKETEEGFEKMCSAMDNIGDFVIQEVRKDDGRVGKYDHIEKKLLSMADNGNKDLKHKKDQALEKISEMKEIRIKAAMQMEDKKMQAREGSFKNTDGFDDGDQSPLKGNARRILGHQWSSGMDYNPLNPGFSNLLRVLFIGDSSTMMNIVKNTRKDAIPQLVERRESLLNIGPIFHVINGAKMLKGDSEEHAELRKTLNNGKNDHMACFLKLLELGVNIKSKDVLGCTPLHHCVTKFANDETMNMAKILIKNGANVNEQNRGGATPLMEPTSLGKLDVVEMLLKHGADPGILDNDGKSCLTILPFMYPKIEAIFGKSSHKFAKAKRKEAREEAGGSLRKCEGCGSMEKDNKRWYCERPCQLKNWKQHKEECKETQEKYVPVILQREKVMTTKNWKTGQVYVSRDTDVPSSSHFLVKIQVPENVSHPKTPNRLHTMFSGGANPFSDLIFVYNKERSMLGYIPPQDSSYTQMMTIIKEKGLLGCKGFFYATWKDGILKINITDIQPPEAW